MTGGMVAGDDGVGCGGIEPCSDADSGANGPDPEGWVAGGCGRSGGGLGSSNGVGASDDQANSGRAGEARTRHAHHASRPATAQQTARRMWFMVVPPCARLP
jgi:hypothetical protein